MKILLLTPSKGSICLEQRNMLLRLQARLRDGGHVLSVSDDTTNGFLDHSRNVLLTALAQYRPDWGLWLDSDTYLNVDAILSNLERPEDMITWSYPLRWPHDTVYPPEKFRHLAVRRAWTAHMDHVMGEPVWSQDKKLILLKQCGFGAVLMRPVVADTIAKEHGFAPRDWAMRSVIKGFNRIDAEWSFGEDYSFCKRWRAAGGKIWCDPFPYVTNGSTGGCFADELKKFALQRKMCRQVTFMQRAG